MNFKGISYPFRISVRGGVEVSEATPTDVTHINEGIEQLLKTFPFERTMEFHIGSKVNESIFQNITPVNLGLLKLAIVRALASDDRIVVTIDDIHIVSTAESSVVLYIEYYLKEFNARYTTTTLTLGEGNSND